MAVASDDRRTQETTGGYSAVCSERISVFLNKVGRTRKTSQVNSVIYLFQVHGTLVDSVEAAQTRLRGFMTVSPVCEGCGDGCYFTLQKKVERRGAADSALVLSRGGVTVQRTSDQHHD